jgi:excinuclease UvrABC nuclease subunit
VDVIRNKIKVEDTDIHELLVLAEQEAWTAITVKYKSETVWKKLSWSEDYHEQWVLDAISQHIAHGVVVYPEQWKYIHANLSDIDSIIQTSLDSYIISSSFESDNVMNGLLDGLQQRYFLKEYPYEIECVDISHFGGKQTSGGLSSIQWGIPHKYGYRRYKIHSTDKGDDYKALREVVIRRFKLQTSKTTPEVGVQFPTLFILDGGKAQLWVVVELIKEFPVLHKIMQQTQFASLEKWKARKRSSRGTNSEVLHVLLDDGNIVSKNLIYDKIDHLLVKLRDEAHRFANQYRKKQASKEWKD